MIKETKVLIPINQRNYKTYIDLGYVIYGNPTIDKIKLEIDVNHLSKGSHFRITSICDICSKESSLSIQKYWVNYHRGGYNIFTCKQCKNSKTSMTVMKKYGVDSFSKTEEFKNKFKETCIERYGVDNPNKLLSVRDKIKETCTEKYGLVTHLLSDANIEKNKEWMSSEEFKYKSKETNLLKYGVDSFSKTEEFKEIIKYKKDDIIRKMKLTFMRNYGVEYYSKTSLWRKATDKIRIETTSKTKDTNLEKYGVDNVSKVPEFLEKSKNTKIERNLIISDSELSSWELYKRNVRKYSAKNFKKLFENWNGRDYYDGELIKDYFIIEHTDNRFPCVDHKISTIYGFKNNISYLEISDISNLCITKRRINSSKGGMTEEEFKMKIYFNI